MADAVGNVNLAPGSSVKATTTDKELLASSHRVIKRGVTLRVGGGVLAVGTPLVKHDDGTYGALGSADRQVAATVTFTDTGDVVTTPAAHGLSVNDEVKVATVVTTTGIVANTVYFVKTVPTATTVTLSATKGGSTLALTTDGTGTVLSQVETSSDLEGFLKHEVDTTGPTAKLGNIITGGVLNYTLIKAANGNTDLDATALSTLNARLDATRNEFIF